MDVAPASTPQERNCGDPSNLKYEGEGFFLIKAYEFVQLVSRGAQHACRLDSAPKQKNANAACIKSLFHTADYVKMFKFFLDKRCRIQKKINSDN